MKNTYRKPYDRILIPILLGFLLFSACGKAEPVFETGEALEETKETLSEETESLPESLVVHVCGAVREPGVYTLPAGSRYVDAALAAGGFTEEAVPEALNLAEPVTDGSRIYFCTEEEYAAGASDFSENSGSEDHRVDINHADAGELMTLKGIGETRAKAILEYREKYGLFESPEELMLVPGIKESVYDKLKEQIKAVK